MLYRVIAILTIVCLFSSCEPEDFFEHRHHYDYYYDYYKCKHYGNCPEHGYGVYEHKVATGTSIYYVRTLGCPECNYNRCTRKYECWDRHGLILESYEPIKIWCLH